MLSSRCHLFTSVVVLSTFFCSVFSALQSQKPVFKLSEDEGPVLNYLNMTIANLHSLFVNGIPELGVAPFDPIDLGSVHVASIAGSSADVSEASADAESLVLTGLSNFRLDDLQFHLVELSGMLQLTWPNVEVTGTYSANGLVSGQQATASGSLDVDLASVVLNSSLVIEMNGTTPQISTLTLKLYLGKSTVTLSNLVGSVELQDAYQAYVQDLLDEIYNAVLGKLDGLAQELADLLNQVLAGIGQNGIKSAPSAILSLGHQFAFKFGLSAH